MDKWNELPDEYQAMLETACDANIAQEFADGEASQFQAMIDNEADGVTNVVWSDEHLDQFRAAWDEVLQEEISANPDAKKLWESYSAFAEKYKAWGDRGYLK